MSAILASLIPTFLIIATCWLCRATNFLSEQHWAGLERATYVIFFPALIIDTLSRADLSSVPVLGVGGALIGAILTMAALVLALRPVLERRLGIDGPSFTSIFQGATRWNTFVGLAVAGSLFGQRGIALIAVPSRPWCRSSTCWPSMSSSGLQAGPGKARGTSCARS